MWNMTFILTLTDSTMHVLDETKFHLGDMFGWCIICTEITIKPNCYEL